MKFKHIIDIRSFIFNYLEQQWKIWSDHFQLKVMEPADFIDNEIQFFQFKVPYKFEVISLIYL